MQYRHINIVYFFLRLFVYFTQYHIFLHIFFIVIISISFIWLPQLILLHIIYTLIRNIFIIIICIIIYIFLLLCYFVIGHFHCSREKSSSEYGYRPRCMTRSRASARVRAAYIRCLRAMPPRCRADVTTLQWFEARCHADERYERRCHTCQ